MGTIQTFTSAQLLSREHSTTRAEISLLVARSFFDDPSTQWVFDGGRSSRYPQTTIYAWHTMIQAALLCDARFIVVSGNSPFPLLDCQPNSPMTARIPKTTCIRAVNIFFEPGKVGQFHSTWITIRAGMLLTPFKCGWKPFWRYLTQQGPRMQAMHDRIFNLPTAAERNDHWYLFVLCTHPEAQGQGWGGKLLKEMQRQVVEFAERERKQVQPVYLESSSRGSYRLYVRNGFVEKDHFSVGDIGESEDVRRDVRGNVVGTKGWGMVWTGRALG